MTKKDVNKNSSGKVKSDDFVKESSAQHPEKTVNTSQKDSKDTVSKESKPKKKQNKSKTNTKKSNENITSKRNVQGLEKKINDAVDNESYKLPFLWGMINFSDKWNMKVRQPLANKVAKLLIAPPRRTDDSDIKLSNKSRFVLDTFDVMVKIILLFILLNIFSMYTLPLMLGVAFMGTMTFIKQIIILALMLFVWEELNRFLRSIMKYMDYYSNNMVDKRLTDTDEKTTNIGILEGYKIGWAKGDWTKFVTKDKLLRFFLYFLCGLIMSLILNASNQLDVIMGWTNTSQNVQSLNMIANKVPFLLIFTTVFLAPTIEEFVFRGIIFRTGLLFNEKLRPRDDYEQGWQTPNIQDKTKRIRRRGMVLSFIFQAIFFSLAHDAQTLGYGGGLFISAILLQYLYYKTGNIKASIYAHAWSNALAVIIPVLLQIIR